MFIRYLLFSILFIGFSFYVFRVVWRADFRNEKKLSLLSSILGFVAFTAHACSVYIALPAPWPSVALNASLSIVAMVIMSIGGLILLISWFKLGTKTSFGKDRNHLVTDGLYKYSRNPQVLGYGLFLAGLTMLYFNWGVLAWFIVYILISGMMVKTEEEFLEDKYQEEYRQYKQKVGRVV